RGLSAARNFALDNMDPATEYVSFLDSDDWMEPDAVHTLCRAAEEEGADLVSCDYYIIADGKDKRPAFPSDSKVVLTGEERLIRFINRDRLNSMPWNKLYKSALFSDVRLPEDKYFGDSAVVYRLIDLAEKVVLIPDILFDYRIRESSLTFNYSAKRLIDRWDVHLQRYKFLSALVTDEACIRILEGDCLVSIERMWKSWKNFGPEDRRLAKPCLEEMNRFASERRGRVLRERGYKKFHKLICLLAVFKDPRFVVPLLSTAFAVFNFLKKR
ncbi:MAG: glycosyltransferase, partial [Abditibacteriota bacterium]|nr:glycosyltransferase [Abditibacteriota bacterium]